MKRKSICSMIILFLLIQLIFPILTSTKVLATTSGDWEYEVNEDGSTITIIRYNGTNKNVIIPNEIDGYTVTILGDGSLLTGTFDQNTAVFYYNSLIESIELPDSIKKVGKYAFRGCNNLIDIKLNNGLEILGGQAFLDCKKIEEIIIPSTVTSLTNEEDKMNPFYSCNSLKNVLVEQENLYYSSNEGVLFNKQGTILISYPRAKESENYSIPETVTQIYGQAINNNNLKNIYIPANTTNIKGNIKYGEYTNISAILGCENLKNIIVNESNEQFSSEDGILYNKSKSALLFYPSGKEDNYFSIPDTVEECGTISNSYIETIKLSSLISDAEFLINISNLKNIEVSSENENYVQKEGVLFNKKGNKIVYYPMGKTDTTYTIDGNVTEIESKAFTNSKIIELTLPESINMIGSYAFCSSKNLKNINLPNKITSIKSHTFDNCVNLENINIPSNVTSIEDYAFINCKNLLSVTIPKSVVKIGEKAFYNCRNMKELIFEENIEIEEIGRDAFSYCSSIEELNIPEGITNIYSRFDDCENLRIINIPSSVEDISSYDINNNSSRTYPQIITIDENPNVSGMWAFPSADYGITIIRCYSTATNVINWADGKGYFQYNIIDLDEDDEKYLYTINDNNEVTINNYIGDEEVVEIPSQIEGYPVTEIEKVYGTYKNLIIPSTITKIRNIYSSNLENINVDEENQYYSSKDGILFNKSENKLIYYPMGRKDISYDVPEGTTVIGDNLNLQGFFGNIYLQNINIPKSVADIATKALDMNNLSQIKVDEENEKYISKDNILYEINNNEISIKAVPINISGSIELIYGLNKIDTNSFKHMNKLEEIVVSTTVKEFSHNICNRCNNLNKVVIPPTITEINEVNTSFTWDMGEEFKIYCESNSVACEYAKKYGIDYEIIEVDSIEIKQKPNKLTYIEGEEELDLTNGLITINYNDGTILDLAMTSELIQVEGFDNSIVGNNEIELDYKGQTTSFSVEIEEGCNHNYGDWIITKEATCIGLGSKQRTCSECNTIETERILALGHDYESVVTQPTCTEQGYRTHTCTRCDDSYIDTYVVALGHTEVIDVAVEPTCTETGLTEGKHCSRCTEILVAQEEVASLGHSYNSVITESTCTEDGYTTYTCTRCDDSYTDNVVESTGHNYEIIHKDEAVCEQGGKIIYECTNCGDTYEEEIEAKGHAEVVDEAVAPTCTETGLTQGKHCSVCNTVLVGQEEVKALGHDYENVVTQPTCTEQGYITHTCTRCSDSYVDTYTEATGHSYGDWIETETASCEEKGSQEKSCSVCGDTQTEEINALEHTYGDFVVDKEPTCTETGEKSKHCTRCNDSKIEITVILPLGHNFGAWIIDKEATYEEEGHKYRVCTNCNKEKQEESIPKLTKQELQVSTTYTVKEEGNVKHIMSTVNTSVSQILSNITANKEVKVVDKSGKELGANNLVGTGVKIVTKEDNKEIYTVVLQGDVNCDGKITFNDIIRTNAIRINQDENKISKAELFAADIDDSRKIEFRDIIKINAIRINNLVSK